MISIEITRDSNNQVTAISALGHANYGEYGEDIICSAVTAVITTAMAALEDLLGVEHKRRLDDGHVALALTKKRENPATVEQTGLLLESCVLGLKQIEYSYGNEYLCVSDPKDR